ncbi:hypothetical protein M2163_004829 [Streptomyces sp. SAI-135]|uniref:DUF6303 family protein n=1 Tax=unclassified Streptomyces TaxID=2593676 RepID=UPI00247543FA|nr:MULTISPECIES: DUF6303 family protein [unclassified Streptomyces]MDH6518188.1 hypothetical protein [Streptomyces sp. SAI-090]MDH6617721.1 hypothetical protein [Streptomyces sp. SAI-135]
MSEQTTAREFTAQMSVRAGFWWLYVVVLNTTEPWPEHRLGRSVPTFTDRTNALRLLGFEPVPGARWAWTEDSINPDNPASPIVLIAATRIRSLPEVSA